MKSGTTHPTTKVRESLGHTDERPAIITVSDVSLSFGQKTVLRGVDWIVREGSVTTLIGPNGCGKSTLLKSVVGTLHPKQGRIMLKGREAANWPSKELAKYMAFLPQTPEMPKDITVEELVYCGRFPHQNWWRNTAGEDRRAVDDALQATKTSHLAQQRVSLLSGGERQRVWIAMALAQEPSVLLLDEPTTYLDINHQFEIMELLRRLNKERNLTVVMVLHELNQAARYSDAIAVLSGGTIVADGAPQDILTSDLLRRVFSVDSTIEKETDGTPYIKIHGLI